MLVFFRACFQEDIPGGHFKATNLNEGKIVIMAICVAERVAATFFIFVVDGTDTIMKRYTCLAAQHI